MDRNKCKILVVDDSDFSRMNLTQMLKSENIKVEAEASSAEEALKILAEKKIDIAIIDVVMPKISGIELAESISKSFKNTHIIMISSLGQENIVLDSITAGAQDFIQKPIKKEILIHSIDKIAENIQEESI